MGRRHGTGEDPPHPNPHPFLRKPGALRVAGAGAGRWALLGVGGRRPGEGMQALGASQSGIVKEEKGTGGSLK